MQLLYATVGIKFIIIISAEALIISIDKRHPEQCLHLGLHVKKMKLSIVVIFVGIALMFCGKINNVTREHNEHISFQSSDLLASLLVTNNAMAGESARQALINVTITNAVNISRTLVVHMMKIRS